MTPGLVGFFLAVSMLIGAYAIWAPNNPKVAPTTARPPMAGDTFFDKYVRPAVRNFLPQTPLALTEYARKNNQITALLARTGNPWRVTPEEYVVARVLAAVVGIMVGLLVSLFGSANAPIAIVVPIGAIIGFMLPQQMLNGVWKKRKQDLDLTLPEVLDMLRICMDAGYNFSNGLQQTVALLPEGTTRLEMSRVLAEMRAGRTAAMALTGLAYRCPTPAVEAFVRAISQAQATGSDIASTLSFQADETRADYERAVDVKAAKIQTTLFFPIIIFFLPILMIIIFGPVISNLGTAF
jgi:tight adherence protein C